MDWMLMGGFGLPCLVTAGFLAPPPVSAVARGCRGEQVRRPPLAGWGDLEAPVATVGVYLGGDLLWSLCFGGDRVLGRLGRLAGAFLGRLAVFTLFGGCFGTPGAKGVLLYLG